MKPSSRVGLLASFGLLASLAACTGQVGGSATPTGSGTAGTGSGTAGTGSGTAGAGPGVGGSVVPQGTGGSVNPAGVGGTGGSAPPCVGTCVCVPGIPATTQIPRLTRLQYDNAIKDLLGLTALASNSNLPPSEILADDSTGPLTDIQWNGFLSAAEKVATEVVAGANRSMFTTCAATATTACAGRAGRSPRPT